MSAIPPLSHLFFLPLFGLAAGCAAGEEIVDNDRQAPQVVVQSPERGTMTSDDTIVVAGVATDDESGIARVIVAGIEATVDADGNFSVEVPLVSGVNLLDVQAIDRGNNKSTDTRAVLAGEFAEADQIVRDAAQVLIGESTLEALSGTAVEVLDNLEIPPLLAAANPVLTRGTGNCLNVAVDLNDITYGDLDISVRSVHGGLKALVTITDLHADANAHYKVACIGGNSPITVQAAQAVVEADIQLAVSGGSFVANMSDSEANFNNLTIDVGILPSSVIEFVVGDLDESLGASLTELIRSELPPIVADYVSMVDVDQELPFLGESLSVLARPSAVNFDGDGGIISIETRVASPSGGMPYISNPMPLPVVIGDLGLRVTIADDALNQALSALWSTGALNRSIELTTESGADIGGGILDRIALHASLPPVISTSAADGSLTITIGDLIVDMIKDGEDKPVSRIAISMELGLAVRNIDGVLKFRTGGEPILHMTRLDKDGFLTDRDLEILVAFGSTALAGDLDKLLGAFPLPSFKGTRIENPQFSAHEGYLHIGANLVR